MNTILLDPTDVLFFRDGRPMGGASAGHGAAWPLPNVTDAALHAALRRSELGYHTHDQIKRDGSRDRENTRCFGSLVTAGPFPVKLEDGVSKWFFPRPLDLQTDTLKPSLVPCTGKWSTTSSLPTLLSYAVAHTDETRLSKDSAAKAWLSEKAFERYLTGSDDKLDQTETLDDCEFSDSEANIGIAIDPDTQTAGQGAAEGKIYSAHYLRLREDWRLGLFAKTNEKVDNDSDQRADRIAEMFGKPCSIIIGGQQRVCTTLREDSGNRLPLPRGLCSGFNSHSLKVLVKWVLLSPAVWPEIEEGISKRNTMRKAHPGGWLPTWVDPTNGSVLLRTLNSAIRLQRRRLNYAGQGYTSDHGGASPISAKLVAALVPKPVVVTGWAIGDENLGDEGRPGAKSTHLAVPAGAVYYFEAHSVNDANALAAALNWYGSGDGSEIKNRRSTLLGEKGFGLGVCGTWQLHGEHSV